MSLGTAARGRISRLPAQYSQAVHMRPRLKGLKAYANWIRSYYEYKRGFSEVTARPLKLIFDPTNACQLKCPLCPTGLGMVDRQKGHADLGLFKNLMEQVGDYVFVVDFYNWGEPLLNPKLHEFISIADTYNVISRISSNLSLRLSDERIDRLLTSGISEIIISLDGATKQTHTKYRRNSDFDLICENMRRLAEARRRLGQSRPLLTWQFVVFRFNEHEVDRAAAMAAEIGVDRIKFQSPFLQPERYRLSDEDKQEIASWAPVNPRYHAHIAKTRETHRCGWHYTTGVINWDGAVAPCCTTFEKADDFGTLGKMGEHSYVSVVNNSAFQRARKFLSAGTSTGGLICERCPTPGIQDYHYHVYRQIAIITCIALAEAVRLCFSVLARGLWKAAPVAPSR